MKKRFYFCLFVLFAWVGALQGQIVNIPDANFKAKLIALGVDTNSDGEIQTTEAQSITKLNVWSTFINDLTGIEAFVNLDTLDCSSNYLTSLNVSTLTNLKTLLCDYNDITSLDLSNLVNLYYLECISNNLTYLNVNNCPSIHYLNCMANQLTNLDLSTCINLDWLSCSHNEIVSLDVNNCSILTSFDCSSNIPLLSLFVKNGSNEGVLFFDYDTNLQYICADSFQIDTLIETAILNGLTNTVVNDFCSSVPGGDYNTVSGTTIYDMDMNGCTASDSIHSYMLIHVTNGIDTGYVYSNNIGHYEAYLDTGTYSLIPHLQNNSYFSLSPISPSFYFSNDSNNVQTQDFCIVPNGVFLDVEIALSPIFPSIPGFDAIYLLTFHNKGTTAISGDIIVDFDGTKMTFVNANQGTSAQTANQLTWTYSNLQPFETRNILFMMNMLPPPINNVGDVLNFGVSIPLVNDADSVDNSLNFIQDVVGSYDPNDKTCIEGHHLLNSQIGDYLHYLIRFQNTGNYPADHVVVVDSIDVDAFELGSLQVLETSHSAHIGVSNGVLQFYFEDIQLADSFSNEAESHGYVLYKIRTNGGLAANGSVSNGAEIYFDYNLPVVTNVEVTTFGNTVGIGEGVKEVAFRCYPNPVGDVLVVESGVEREVVVLNVMGEVVMRKGIVGKVGVDVSGLVSGVYWVRDVDGGEGQVFIKQ